MKLGRWELPEMATRAIGAQRRGREAPAVRLRGGTAAALGRGGGGSDVFFRSTRVAAKQKRKKGGPVDFDDGRLDGRFSRKKVKAP